MLAKAEQALPAGTLKNPASLALARLQPSAAPCAGDTTSFIIAFTAGRGENGLTATVDIDVLPQLPDLGDDPAEAQPKPTLSVVASNPVPAAETTIVTAENTDVGNSAQEVTTTEDPTAAPKVAKTGGVSLFN